MPSYKAPVDDFKFILKDFLQILEHKDLPGFDVLDDELIVEDQPDQGRVVLQGERLLVRAGRARLQTEHELTRS